MKNRVPVCASLLFMFSAQNAFGADLAIAPSTSDKTQYKAADFAQFAPRTALDIVRRIPGCSKAQKMRPIPRSGPTMNLVSDRGA
jgi:hypothetical protein